MKKIYVILLSLPLIVFSSCMLLFSLNEMQMVDYYSDDSNYKSLTGEILEINLFGENDTGCRLVINIISDAENFFPVELPVESPFDIYNFPDLYRMLYVGDIITFLSAPEIFYDGQCSPIVYVEKNGEVLLTFEEGKEAYINWIKTN